jgi:hypothetical protein
MARPAPPAAQTDFNPQVEIGAAATHQLFPGFEVARAFALGAQKPENSFGDSQIFFRLNGS